MLCQVYGELLPSWKHFAAKSAGLILRAGRCLNMTLFNLLPCRIHSASTLHGSLVFDFGLQVLVFAHQMLQKIVPSVARVSTIVHITRPPFQMPVTFVFVTDPVSFTLEYFWISALVPCTGERLHVLMYMLCPVGRLLELLLFIAELTLKLCRQVLSWRHGNVRREAFLVDCAFRRHTLIVLYPVG